MSQRRPIPLTRTTRLLLSAALALTSLSIVFLVPKLIATGWKGRLVLLDPVSNVVLLSIFRRHFYIYAWRLQIDSAYFAIVVGGFLAAYLAYPEFSSLLAAGRLHWRKGYTAALLALTCAGLSAFILHFGNRQFGGFDFSFIIDLGWRLAQGQLPYRDFFCTMPPGFYLGLKYAFLLFGVRWEAILMATAIFASATFLWTYFLLAEILPSQPLAYFGAVAIQCAALLTVSYWWYNNVTMIVATIFFLSCLLFLQRPESRAAQISFLAALALLGLMKPNVAGPAAASGIFCCWLGAPRRTWLLLLTFLATGVDLVFLTTNHVDLSGLIASYLSVAGTRGFTANGMLMMGLSDVLRLAAGLLVLALPLAAWWPRFLDAARTRSERDLARSLLLLSAPAVSLFAMCTNMELKDVEFPLCYCFGLVLTIAGSRIERADWVRTYLCFVLVLAAFDIYLGAVRYRVQLVGDFFSSQEEVPLPSGIPLFGNMAASQALSEAVQEAQRVVATSPRPVFFGPRMEFGYAAFRLPSPAHWPVQWVPGTTFPRDAQGDALQSWQNQCFQTLIFLKNDYTDYPSLFRRNLITLYDQKNDWAGLTVFRRKSAAACPNSSSSR
jgi:hypothetical protein